MSPFNDRYGRDVLTNSPHPKHPVSTKEAAVPGLVVEDVQTGYVGAVVEVDKHGVILEDRHGKRRAFPLGPGFWIDGKPVELVRPAGPAKTGRMVSASGSVAVLDHKARTARASRIYVEGKHDAELVEKVWGHDLRVEGVVVEELGGADDLAAVVAEFQPGPGRRLGVMLDHLVAGSKETRLADAVRGGPYAGDVLIVGHPYIDVWQAVRPSVLGLKSWPDVPKGEPWKEGVIARLGWKLESWEAWQRILGRVTTYTDLEPAFLGRVEELIDFVTDPPG
ncbi:DUF3097 domain-containing protein [Jiangella rhizosphaerae]|uniref:DUF3097 domain-containing protein n=1 Tax=Jiangella rhizosphaerae TaxID=2293569 RepID=A0A418KIW6_9ACTN|nr:DUF3097 domain-containing protein [Jiangella rhizosphaerae]RIQ13707.1 DUF3097 domain-containing protein [Jiangella rhizosphaerae]